MRWWRRLSLRGRLTLVGSAGLAAGLALGGALILLVLHFVLINSVDSTARNTANDVAVLVEANKISIATPIPAPNNAIVQVVTADGTVQGSSESSDRADPMLDPDDFAQARRGHVVVLPGDRVEAGGTGTVRVVAQEATAGRVPEWVLVASPTKSVDDSTEAVQSVLLVAYPLLVAALAFFTYRLVGWALRPVESLRQGAAMISASGRQVGRLPVPDGKDEVNRLAVTLNDMLDRLDAARSRQQAFVADAAHELRSPIASLRTQLEVAAHLDEPAPTDELMADVARLGRLVDDLLLLARADEGDPRLRLVEAVDVGELAASVTHGYCNARVPVSCESGPGALTLGDPIAVGRVIDNLVGNAVKHASSRVGVNVSHGDDAVHVVVTDDGPGIPAEDRERVFDRFTRLDNSRARSDDDGAGLGLAIVRELLRLHNGAIALGDAGPGLRVDVTLPAAGPDGELRTESHDPISSPTAEVGQR
ncbi:MAG TPA: HAMP domain-containing sensor histidine kinase [Micromonosporaceae bacterium]|jgi:signal transduction histidine kinase